MIGYPDMIGLLCYHMAGNALKFQPEGAQPRLDISCETLPGAGLHWPGAAKDAQYHCIGFRDNGIGFEPEYSEKIFGMFQRLHTHSVYKGTGMGLALCRKVAEAHEGFISATGEPGKGAAFCCYLKVQNVL